MGNKNEGQPHGVGNERFNGNRTVGPSHRVIDLAGTNEGISPTALKIFNIVDANSLATEMNRIHQQAKRVDGVPTRHR